MEDLREHYVKKIEELRKGRSAIILAHVYQIGDIQGAGQPELSPDPGIEPISLAAESAFQKFYNS